MWVIVNGRVGDVYVGRLDNQPVSSERLGLGDPVFFGPEHVIDISTEPVVRM